MILRNWELSDNEEIERLEKLYFKSAWSRAMLDSCFTACKNFYGLVYEENGKIIAYIGTFYNMYDVEVLNVCVDERYRRKKLATHLFECVFARFSQSGAENIYLEVRRSNTAAVNLYESLGFVRIGERKKYYENTEDALVMARSLKKN